jgi:hypothetical protein
MRALVEGVGAEDGLVVVFREDLSAGFVARDHFSVAVEFLMHHTLDGLYFRKDGLGRCTLRRKELWVIREERGFIGVRINQIETFLDCAACS